MTMQYDLQQCQKVFRKKKSTFYVKTCSNPSLKLGNRIYQIPKFLIKSDRNEPSYQ